MFRPETGHSMVTFILGNEEEIPDGEQHEFGCPVDFIPRVGDEVNIMTTRDRNGNYLNEHLPLGQRNKFRNVISKAAVIRIVHYIDETGNNSRDHRWQQSILVYLKRNQDDRV